jgi:hypothetical protein
VRKEKSPNQAYMERKENLADQVRSFGNAKRIQTNTSSIYGNPIYGKTNIVRESLHEKFNHLRTDVYFCHQNKNAKNIGNF